MDQIKGRVVERTLYYKRAVWVNGSTVTLQSCLSNAHEKLTSTKNRTFQYPQGQIQGLYIKSSEAGLFCQVALYNPDQPTSLVTKPSEKEEHGKAIPENPPDNFDFMSGDIFFLVKDNHVVLCPSGAREGVVSSYIEGVLLAAEYKDFIDKFKIKNIANIDKMKMIKDEGVKSISLNSSYYEASLKYINRKMSVNRDISVKDKLLGVIVKEFCDLFYKDDACDMSEKENLSVNLEISLDKRNKENLGGQRRLDDAASKLIIDSEDSGFAIVTRKGNRIKSDEIKIKEKCKLSSFGNSVDRYNAYSELKLYLGKLRDGGILEQ